jgi:hypothetical protein
MPTRIDPFQPQSDRLPRQHRQALALAASLAGRLRLPPVSRLDRRQRQDGDDVITEHLRDPPGPRLRSIPRADDGDERGERNFEDLRRQFMRDPRAFYANPATDEVPTGDPAATEGTAASGVGAISVRGMFMATEAADENIN